MVDLALACLAWALLTHWQRGASEPFTIVHAYIGPGAGIALVGSFLAVLVAMLSALMALVTWPVRWLWRMVRGHRARARAKVRRVVVLGLDGLDPQLVDTFLAEGLLPNLARLRDEGVYTRLGTTWPPLSPVAWSSFSTGANPGKHNIFDFIMRSRVDYRPRMSSVHIHPPRRTLRLGKWRLPLSQPRIEGLRKSKPFWTVLGESGVFSSILRVPITFPPDRFRGLQLSAMCVPDLRGTQGMFAYFIEREGQGVTMDGDIGGERIAVERRGSTVTAWLPGPENPLRKGKGRTRLPVKVVAGKNGAARLHISGQSVLLRPHEYTDWVPVSFPLAPGVKARGICRFLLKQFEPPFEMYATPVNIAPDKPVMPISHPGVYATYLAKKLGPFATLGLAEDTWSLSEGAIDEAEFLKQAYDIDRERQQMFFDALDNVRRGLVVCVFDGPDRIQHMFWRFLDDGHPARGSDQSKVDANRDVIRTMYQRMDDLVGRARAAIDSRTALVVLSDHGFKSFRRGVDLNAWLLENGYLKLKNGVRSTNAAYLVDVDWSGTRAFAIGLAGILLNVKGREAQGIVSPGAEARELADQLCKKLTGLRDDERGQVAIHQAVTREEVYHGPYVDAAPDVIVGYNAGYRVSWDAANGKCSEAIFSDNLKAWSGDHCIHPELAPGVLFSNLPLRRENAQIVDLAPTVLELLGVKSPEYFDGQSLLVVA